MREDPQRRCRWIRGEEDGGKEGDRVRVHLYAEKKKRRGNEEEGKKHREWEEGIRE